MAVFEAFNERKTLSKDSAHQILDKCKVTYTTKGSLIYTAGSTYLNLATFLGSALGFPEPQHQSHRSIITKLYVIKCPPRYSDFITERNMLEACNCCHHPHIVPLVASFDFEGTGYLIMPAAVMDLAELFGRRTQTETEDWLISQLAGLADALGAVHSHLQSAEGEKLFGLHSDIKASNVLVLKPIDRPASPPMLQLADFGSSQLFDGPEKASNIHCACGSGTYAAPECVLEHPYSQAADIRSFSCLVLESLIWFKQGPQGLQSFAESRMHKSSPYGMALTADYFFKLEPTQGEEGDQTPCVRSVNPAVTARIDELRSFQECGGSIRSLLDLLEQRLLVIDPARRMSAEELVLQLKCLVDDGSSINRSEEEAEGRRNDVEVFVSGS